MPVEDFDIQNAEGAQFSAYRTVLPLLPESFTMEELTDFISMLLLTYTTREDFPHLPIILARILHNVRVNYEADDDH